MAFFIYDYSNTHIFHRKALLNAIEKANTHAVSSADLTVVVSTKNMIKALPSVLLGRITPVLNIVGFGRLYSDYGLLGRFVFNTIIRLYGITSCRGFIVEHNTDQACLEQLGLAPVFTSHGSGLDVDGFTRNRPAKRKQLTIGYLSRFDESKGSEEVLKAAKNWPSNRKLVIAGWDIKGARYAKQFQALADANPNITFLGKLTSRQAVSAFFNDLDIFLSPSRREGGNIALQEAIWHHVPFLTTDAPGCDVLAARFHCPAVPMNQFSDEILRPDLEAWRPDTSNWDALLAPFMTDAVADELYAIFEKIGKA